MTTAWGNINHDGVGCRQAQAGFAATGIPSSSAEVDNLERLAFHDHEFAPQQHVEEIVLRLLSEPYPSTS